MQNIDMRKIYNFHPIEPTPDPGNLPTRGNIYYECPDCSTIVNSLPFIMTACSCGNLEGGEGKLTVKNPTLVLAAHGTLK